MKALLLSSLLLVNGLLAQGVGHPVSSLDGTDLGAQQTDAIGHTVDASLTFTDERGYPFGLKQLFPGKQPVVLMLGYYSCPAMCGQVLGAAFDALSEDSLQPGVDYRVLNVSINPAETAAMAMERKQKFLPKLRKIGGDEAWRVLVGDAASVKKLADAVGFHYYWAEATQQFAHPPSLIFLTPEGKVSRIITSTVFETSDVHLALVEASNGTLGTFWDRVRLNCLTYDPRTKSYSLAAMTLMRVAGAITVIVLAAMIWIMLRRERRSAQTPPQSNLNQPSPLRS